MLNKSCLRNLLLVSLALLLLAAASCGGGERTAQLDQGAYSPQASSPLDIMPPSQMLAAQGTKGVSSLTLYLKGKQFATKPKQRLVDVGDDAQFSPAWDGNWSGFEAVAFGAYRLNVMGYTGTSVLNFDWTTPPTDLSDVWIGLSLWTKDRWVWFPAPADGSLELPAPGYTQFTKAGAGDILVAVVVLGNDISLFHHLWIGNTIPVHTITGDVKTAGGTGIEGVSVSFTGGLPAVTTDATGHYVRDAVYDGSYTITPSKAGCIFTPAYRTVVVNGLDPSPASFATAPSYAGGYVKLEGGAGVEGVTMSFTNGVSSVVTDSAGHWQVGPIADGDYTVTPSKTGYSFAPASADFTMAGVNVIVPDITGDSNIASGLIKDGGDVGIAGVTVSFTNGLSSVVTDATGHWQRDAIPDGTYTATPAKAGYTFAPTSRDFTIAANDQTVGDFVGTGSASIDILTVTTDKTTHCSDASETASQLNVTTDPTPADTYTWSGQGDFSSTTIANPTWKPNGSTKLGKVTLTVTVTLGGANDSATIDLYVTGESIKTSYVGRNGSGTFQVGDPAGSGICPDASFVGTQYLQPLIDGGAITAGSGTFHELTIGKPILFDEWELWCNPCKLEYPELDDYGEIYRPYDFMFIANSTDTRAAYNIDQIKAWFQANTIDYCNDYHGSLGSMWAKLGADGYIPFNVLIDRDGMVRKVGGQANGSDWATCIQEISGSI
jgi:hypothetical protein